MAPESKNSTCAVSRAPRARSYTFTINNPDHPSTLTAIKNGLKGTKYIIVGYETAPSTGTKHYQGYVSFDNPVSFNTLKKVMPTAHIEPAKGSAAQNREYCTKEETVLEFGTIPSRGTRSDLSSVRKSLDNNYSIQQVVMEATNNNQIKYAYEYLKFCEKPRDIAPIEVHWYYGPSGSGKSFTAHSENPDLFKPYDYDHWEGYDSHKTVLLDDIRAGWCTYNQLLQLLDSYPLRVRCLYGTRQAQFNKIIITCPVHPLHFYCTHEDKWQLLRRITVCKEFTLGVTTIIHNLKHDYDEFMNPPEDLNSAESWAL